MRRVVAFVLLAGCLLLTSCVEVVLVGAGAVAGGAVGYYAGKEGYKIKVEKEKGE